MNLIYVKRSYFCESLIEFLFQKESLGNKFDFIFSLSKYIYIIIIFEHFNDYYHFLIKSASSIHNI